MGSSRKHVFSLVLGPNIFVRDTVSSIGIFRRLSLPLASPSPKVKYYRHALALDELRVRFLAEYLDVKGQDEQAQQAGTTENPPKPDVKEVWFVGTHSDVYVFVLL